MNLFGKSFLLNKSSFRIAKTEISPVPTKTFPSSVLYTSFSPPG